MPSSLTLHSKWAETASATLQLIETLQDIILRGDEVSRDVSFPSKQFIERTVVPQPVAIVTMNLVDDRRPVIRGSLLVEAWLRMVRERQVKYADNLDKDQAQLAAVLGWKRPWDTVIDVRRLLRLLIWKRCDHLGVKATALTKQCHLSPNGHRETVDGNGNGISRRSRVMMAQHYKKKLPNGGSMDP